MEKGEKWRGRDGASPKRFWRAQCTHSHTNRVPCTLTHWLGKSQTNKVPCTEENSATILVAFCLVSDRRAMWQNHNMVTMAIGQKLLCLVPKHLALSPKIIHILKTRACLLRNVVYILYLRNLQDFFGDLWDEGIPWWSQSVILWVEKPKILDSKTSVSRCANCIEQLCSGCTSTHWGWSCLVRRAQPTSAPFSSW